MAGEYMGSCACRLSDDGSGGRRGQYVAARVGAYDVAEPGVDIGLVLGVDLVRSDDLFALGVSCVTQDGCTDLGGRLQHRGF